MVQFLPFLMKHRYLFWWNFSIMTVIFSQIMEIIIYLNNCMYCNLMWQINDAYSDNKVLESLWRRFCSFKFIMLHSWRGVQLFLYTIKHVQINFNVDCNGIQCYMYYFDWILAGFNALSSFINFKWHVYKLNPNRHFFWTWWMCIIDLYFLRLTDKL